MDNLGAIAGPLLALGLVATMGIRSALLLSVIPGLLAALAILYAIHHIPRPVRHERQPIRLQPGPVLRGRLGRLMVGITAFEAGNVAATLLILRASTLLPPEKGLQRAEVVVNTYGLHGLAQSGEITLDVQGSHVVEVMEPERAGEPLQASSVPCQCAGRAVADAPAEEKRVKGSLKPRFGVSTCFLGPV